ncbi:MAG: exopolyphosphatase [Rothia sp. (in: high G+C Gram-positive bacteria)]|nr:exopolyphosphatase [Rothia sp. (in: high G+C Gram-positive bacteria)]
MRIGAIDCGTNSIRLLIAEVQQGADGPELRDVVRMMKIVRLGEGVDSTHRFADAALQRTFAVAREYAALIAEHRVESLRFGATSATRDAENRDVFINEIQNILGVQPEVISGTEEAALSFVGAVSAIGNSEENTLVIDLGGGSTEFVLGNQSGVSAAYSANIGCVRLTERHQVSAPMTAQQRELIEADVDVAIEEVLQHVDLCRAQRLVGVAGTVTTVVAQALNLESYDSSVINATELSVEKIEQAANDLANMSREEREALGFMHSGRVDVIGTGAVIWARIVRAISERTGAVVNSAIASEFDILDGLVLSQIK